METRVPLSESDPVVSPRRNDADMPSAVTGDVGVFDRFATAASRAVSRAPFFALCFEESSN